MAATRKRKSTARKHRAATKPATKKKPTRRSGKSLSPATANRKNLPYRPCVGVMLLNKDGLVFVGNRVDQTVESWQMPQGGIDEGETPRQAVMRELKEEIGTDRAEIIREHDAWLKYDLPPELVGVAWEGKYRGQMQRWFALRYLGEDRDIDLATGHQEFSNWKWAPMRDLPNMIVPFKRAIYAKVARAFADLARPSKRRGK